MRSQQAGAIAAPGSQMHIKPSTPASVGQGMADFKNAAANARQATQERDWQRAARWWREAIGSSPDFEPAYAWAGTALRNAGRVDEAEELLSLAACQFPDNEAIALVQAQIANAAGNWSLAMDRWEAFCAKFPGSADGWLGRFNALRGAGRADEVTPLLGPAEDALSAAVLHGEGTRQARWLAFEISRERAEPKAMRAAANALMETPQDPRQLVGLAQACWNAREFESADRAASLALTTDPTIAAALVIRAGIATEHGDGEAALAFYAKLSQLNPDAVRWRLTRNKLLNWMGRTADAAHEFDAILQRWPNEPMVRAFLRTYRADATLVLGQQGGGADPVPTDLDTPSERELRALAERTPPAVLRLRSLVDLQPDIDVIQATCPGAKTAALIFTGFNDALSIPLAIFDPFLATVPVSAVYLKDFKRLRYLQGVTSFADDYAGTLAALRDLISRLKVSRLVTMGNCIGGFAAIRYGVELGADRIIAFDAPTRIGHDTESGIQQGFNFLRKRLAASVPAEMTDLRPFLEERRNHIPIELYYQAEIPERREDSERLSDLPGIQLNPLPGVHPNHALRHFALSQADFGQTLGDILGVSAPAPF